MSRYVKLTLKSIEFCPPNHLFCIKVAILRWNWCMKSIFSEVRLFNEHFAFQFWFVQCLVSPQRPSWSIKFWRKVGWEKERPFWLRSGWASKRNYIFQIFPSRCSHLYVSKDAKRLQQKPAGANPTIHNVYLLVYWETVVSMSLKEPIPCQTNVWTRGMSIVLICCNKFHWKSTRRAFEQLDIHEKRMLK